MLLLGACTGCRAGLDVAGVTYGFPGAIRALDHCCNVGSITSDGAGNSLQEVCAMHPFVVASIDVFVLNEHLLDTSLLFYQQLVYDPELIFNVS